MGPDAADALLAAGAALAVAAGAVASVWLVRRSVMPAPQSPAEHQHDPGTALVLLPVVGGPVAERTVTLACRMAAEQGARLLLVATVEVPYTLPLDAAMADADAQAVAMMSRAAATARQWWVTPTERIQRCREAAEGVVQAARDYWASTIVLGLPPDADAAHRTTRRLIGHLLRYAPCEVVLDRPCIAGHTPPAGNRLRGVLVHRPPSRQPGS